MLTLSQFEDKYLSTYNILNEFYDVKNNIFLIYLLSFIGNISWHSLFSRL